jgi:hypothetical protein
VATAEYRLYVGVLVQVPADRAPTDARLDPLFSRSAHIGQQVVYLGEEVGDKGHADLYLFRVTA